MGSLLRRVGGLSSALVVWSLAGGALAVEPASAPPRAPLTEDVLLGPGSPLWAGPQGYTWHPSGASVTWLEKDPAVPGRHTLVSVDLTGIKRWLLTYDPSGGGAAPPPAASAAAPASAPAPAAAPTPAPTPTPAPRPAPPPAVPTTDPSQLYNLPGQNPPDLSRGLPELGAPQGPAPTPAPPPKPTPPPPPPPPAASGTPLVDVPLYGYTWAPDGEHLLLNHGDLTLVRVSDGSRRALTDTPDVEEEAAVFSPDGARLLYTADHHVYVVEIATGVSRRLSPDAPARVHQGTLDWVYREELTDEGEAPALFAPQGDKVAWLVLDDTQVPHHPVIHHTETPPRWEEQAYPFPGDPLPRPGIRVSDLAGNITATWTLPEEGYVAPYLTFTPDGRGVVVVTLDRPQRTLKLRLIDTRSGEETLLHSLTMPHWHPLTGPPRFLPDGKYIFMSPLMGYVEPYLGDVDRPKKELKRLLKVPWNLRLLGMDPEGEWMYLAGSGDVPTERHLFKVKTSGGSFTRMTLRWGWHDVSVSPRGDAFVDTFSSVESLPVSTLWRDRQKVADLYDAREHLGAWDLGTREIVKIKGVTEDPLYASLQKPPGFDPKRRYPVVVSVYGGPAAQMVTEQFAPNPLELALLARGYLVWTLDNRGSSERMHRFQTALAGELGKVELEDQLLGLAWLKKQPWVDGSRIGMLGGSYGGYLTMYALTHSDAFRAGVAVAPVTDWRRYDAVYTERYLGTPAENPAGYAASAVVDRAAQVRGDLLIVHSAEDENVHVDHTLAFQQGAWDQGLTPKIVITPAGGHRSRAGSPKARRLGVDLLLGFLDQALASSGS